MKYAWIENHRDEYTVSRMCRVLSVSRSGYCQWRVRSPSARELSNQTLDARVAVLHRESRRSYGRPRITQQLRQQGITDDEMAYFLVEGQATNAAYLPSGDQINIKLKTGQVIDIADASDLPNIKALTHIVRRYYICWAKNLDWTLRGATGLKTVHDMDGL